MCKRRVTYRWKVFNKGYNFTLHLTLIGGLHKALWPSKILRIPILRISRLLTWESRDKLNLDATPMANHNKYYEGRWWLPPSLGRGESYESMYAHGSFRHQKCSNHTLTNLWFDFCKSMWIINLIVIRLSTHPGTLARHFTLKVLWVKEHTLTPSIVFIFKFAFEFFKECGGVSKNLQFKSKYKINQLVFGGSLGLLHNLLNQPECHWDIFILLVLVLDIVHLIVLEK